jgi:hypothetical protein
VVVFKAQPHAGIKYGPLHFIVSVGWILNKNITGPGYVIIICLIGLSNSPGTAGCVDHVYSPELIARESDYIATNPVSQAAKLMRCRKMTGQTPRNMRMTGQPCPHEDGNLLQLVRPEPSEKRRPTAETAHWHVPKRSARVRHRAAHRPQTLVCGKPHECGIHA